MMAKRNRNHPSYRGNYWAIVLGPKGDEIKPRPIYQFVRTANKPQFLARARQEYEGVVVRAILQPIPPVFEAGM